LQGVSEILNSIVTLKQGAGEKARINSEHIT